MDLSPVPEEKTEWERIRHHVRRYLVEKRLIPPLSMEELFFHADVIIKRAGAPSNFRDFIAVLTSNAAWEPWVASVPFNRRLLLLPQCLRDRESCPAQLDAFGLVCEQCGQCPVGTFKAEAEALGYVVLVAEGTTVVTGLLETGKVDCVVGVGCLSSLERSFPYMASAAIPGVAIPLARDGCNNTEVDQEWVQEAIRSRSQVKWRPRLDLDRLRSEVNGWFERENLSSMLEMKATRTERMACDWVITGGKRWRPFLAASVYQTLMGEEKAFPRAVRDTAVAVECFHKASLVHDDIEDDDDFRYDLPTLHKRYGIPIALNIGDLLVGEGYRLIADADAPPERKARMLSIAAGGHRDLCLGQGEELAWTRHPTWLTVAKALEIYERKTSPAFEVALSMGAVLAGGNRAICRILKRFSRALGVAYQIRDDLDDFQGKGGDSDCDAMRPTIVLALAFENTAAGTEALFTPVRRGEQLKANTEALKRTVKELELEEKARRIFEQFQSETFRSLRSLENQELKSLLFRLVHKIFSHTSTPTVQLERTAGARVFRTRPGRSASGHG